MKDFKYPKSFPNKEEELFLKLILSNDNNFEELYYKWEREVVFNDINYAVLRLIPLLYLKLKSFNIKSDLIGKIRGMYKMAWYKNQLILDSVKSVIDLFNKENIPIILLKGVPLIENVYKDPGARYLGDADILVDPQYIKKAIKIMINDGWKYLDPSPFYVNRFTEPLTRNKIDKEVTLKNHQDVEIDVHWSLFMFLFKENREHPMSYSEVFKYSLDCDIKGAKYKMPCIEDMIIHIIVHGAERNSHRTLRWVADVVNIIKNKSIDWNFLMERIKKFEVKVEIRIAFIFLSENFSIPIPKLFMEELINIPIKNDDIKEYYRRTDTIEKSIMGTFPYLWNRYWLYDCRGNLFTSWYYFIDYICQSWGINKKRQIPAFIIEKYKKRINGLFHK